MELVKTLSLEVMEPLKQDVMGFHQGGVLTLVLSLLVGAYYRSFFKRLQRKVADQGWSDAESETSEEKTEPASGSNNRS